MSLFDRITDAIRSFTGRDQEPDENSWEYKSASAIVQEIGAAARALLDHPGDRGMRDVLDRMGEDASMRKDVSEVLERAVPDRAINSESIMGMKTSDLAALRDTNLDRTQAIIDARGSSRPEPESYVKAVEHGGWLSTDDTGWERRTSYGRSADGFHSIVESSFLGDDRGAVVSQPFATMELARAVGGIRDTRGSYGPEAAIEELGTVARAASDNPRDLGVREAFAAAVEQVYSKESIASQVRTELAGAHRVTDSRSLDFTPENLSRLGKPVASEREQPQESAHVEPANAPKPRRLRL